MVSPLYQLSARVGTALQSHGWTLVTAESCSGGWIAKAITDVPGSSGWFECGFVTYSDGAKMDLLGVQVGTLQAYGAVSAETVAEMAQGALTCSRASLAVAVSGIAGPDGGSVDKPVGTVWLAWVVPSQVPVCRCYKFNGSREAVREQTVVAALNGILNIVAADPD